MMKCTSSLLSLIKSLSVEPILFFLYFSYFSFNVGAGNLYLQKTCMPSLPLNTNEVCNDPGSISVSAEISTLRTCLREALAGLTVLLAGAWRDRTGLSKPLMMLGLCGEILGTVVIMFGCFFWTSSSWIISSAESLVTGLTGGKILVAMACNCYVMDNSTLENRTSRFVRIVAAVLLGGVISNPTSGPILSALGYKYFFIMLIMIHIATLFLVMILIKDKTIERKTGSILLSTSTIKSVFKSGENNCGIWMVIIATGLVYVVLTVEGNVSLYYLQQGFKFSVTDAGYYNCYRMAVPAICSVIVSTVLTKVFKAGDCKIAAFSAILTAGGAISMVFARTVLELILFALLDIMKPCLVSVLKSILSKLLKPEEAGLYFGLESVVVSILPSVFLPLYNWIFNKTLTTIPGAFFFLSAALLFTIFSLICGTYWIYGEPGSVKAPIDIEAEAKPQEKKNENKLDESQLKDTENESHSLHI